MDTRLLPSIIASSVLRLGSGGRSAAVRLGRATLNAIQLVCDFLRLKDLSGPETTDGG